MSPAEYLPHYLQRFTSEEIALQYYWHALPENWENLNYYDFLKQRREMIANVIRDAFNKL